VAASVLAVSGSGHDSGNRPSGDTEAGAARGRLPERLAVLGVLRREARHQRAAVRRATPCRMRRAATSARSSVPPMRDRRR
jgi:hypothetical protein